MLKEFEIFNVKFGSKKYNCNPETELKMSEDTINEDLKDQPSLFAWYAVLQEKAEENYQTSKMALDVTEAELDNEIRQNEAGKLTEKKIASMIVLDERYQKAKMDMLEARRILGELKAIKEGFSHRKDMLIALSSNMRVQADPELYTNKKKYEKQDIK